MNIYAVRLAVDKQVVGVFAAKSLTDLSYLIDEMTDPSGCEFLALGSGGLCVTGLTPAQWPMRRHPLDPHEVHDDDQRPLDGATMHSFWARRLDVKGSWKAVGRSGPRLAA